MNKSKVRTLAESKTHTSTFNSSLKIKNHVLMDYPESFNKRYSVEESAIQSYGNVSLRRGFDRVSGRHVAIKCFSLKTMSCNQICSAHLEKKLMMRLKHPNIMGLVDFHQDSKSVCLVMDLMTDDLRNVVNVTNYPLEEDFARIIFI